MLKLFSLFQIFAATCRQHTIVNFYQGGSYGKQTCLKEHSDLDMVLFIEDYPLFGGTPASIKRLRSCLEQIKRILQNSLLSTRILISETTPRSLRFQYQCFNNNHVHHVDLMPCNDLLGASPSTGTSISKKRKTVQVF